MNLSISVIYSSFPRKRESRDPRTEAVAPCSCQGQALDPRFRGGDGNPLQIRVPFSVGHLVPAVALRMGVRSACAGGARRRQHFREQGGAGTKRLYIMPARHFRRSISLRKCEEKQSRLRSASCSSTTKRSRLPPPLLLPS